MAQDTKESKEIATQEDPFKNVTDIVTQEDMSDYASTSGLGDNDFEQVDITYGWLKIAQQNSNVVTRGHAKFIDGLMAGQFYDTLSNRNLGDKIELIYLKFFRSYTEYEGKKGEGKFVRTINRNEFKRLVDSKIIYQVEGEGLKVVNEPDHFVQETMNYMVRDKNHPELGIMRFSLGMGSIRQCKAWDTLIDTAYLPDGRPAPKWAYSWILGLSLDTDKGGHNYWNIGVGNKANVTRGERIGQPLRSVVIKNFKFFQETSVEVIDRAGESEYTVGSSTDEAV
jgi:hypothetical protein